MFILWYSPSLFSSLLNLSKYFFLIVGETEDSWTMPVEIENQELKEEKTIFVQ